MKLELKHLAGYLPYKVLVGDGRTPFELTEYNFTNVFPYLTKIYLRPLSDLTKEIEVNREKFVPINRMELYGYYDKSCLNPNNVKSISYNMIQFLFEWHFDVFGLIEKGLAIDINTL